jgi:hypothetical protein
LAFAGPNTSKQPANAGQATKESAMSRNLPTPDPQRPGRLPVPGEEATANPASGAADPINRRQLEESISLSGRERLRCLWYRLRLTIAEMNYATRRMTDLRGTGLPDKRPVR